MERGRESAPPKQASHSKRGLVELYLALPPDLVGDFFPGGGDGVSRLLSRLVLAVDTFHQFVLGDRIVLEDAGDARLDCGVGVIVAVEVRAQIVLDESAVVARRL